MSTIEALLTSQANVAATNEQGSTLLMAAAVTNQLEVLHVLLQHGTHVNAKNAVGRTALMASVERGSAEAVQLLMEHGAATDVVDAAEDSAEDRCEGIEDEGAQEEILALLLQVPGAAQIVAHRRERIIAQAQELRRDRTPCSRPRGCDEQGTMDCCRRHGVGEETGMIMTPQQAMDAFAAL